MPKPLVQTTGRRKQAVARVRLRPFDPAAVATAAAAAAAAAPAPAPAAPAPPAALAAEGVSGDEAAAESSPESSPEVSGTGATEAAPATSTAAPAPPATSTTAPATPTTATTAGSLVINGRPFEAYFPSATQRMIVTEPLRITDTLERYAVEATIDGGGVSGQAGALRLGIARALVELEPELRTQLKRTGLLTRDAREKESKKYGLKKARKAPQYSKR